MGARGHAFRTIAGLAMLLGLPPAARAGDNLIPDPSFEEPMPKNQFGHVFKHWGGWIHEGQCGFRVSDLAHSGKHSLLMAAGTPCKIRATPAGFPVKTGRYRVTAYLRGLDIGIGQYGMSTEFMFDGQYIPLEKNGTFGWSRLEHVGEVKQAGDAHYPSFGLFGPGYLWVDDVSMEAVGPDVPLTPVPLIGPESSPIEPPGPIDASALRCGDCGYKNPPTQKTCYACGAALEAKPGAAVAGAPRTKPIASFEKDNPFEGTTVVSEHATDGTKALRLDRNYAVMVAPQDWSGYEFVKADVFTPSRTPLPLYIEVQDRQTKDYWTRVNYSTVVPPGASTLIVPTALYVGEKARPGRPLDRAGITKFVISIGEKPAGPLFIDNIRLERDAEPEQVQFEGLWAFDVGPTGSAVMEGFTPLDFSKTYTRGRGYGWKDARMWRGFDALQPDPLYQDFLCIEQGGLAIDVPNGSYHVFVNMDSPSGFWGEVQLYRERALILEGEKHVDTLDLATFKARHFRHWDRDDLPSDNTFDTYQVPYFREKEFEVEVRDGQLNIEFQGENWACCVSAIVVYPAAKANEGRKFLEFVRERRRFHFDNAFKRVLPEPTVEVPPASQAEFARGFLIFTRDWMNDVRASDRPAAGEKVAELNGAAFAGELESITISVAPVKELGKVRTTVSDLISPSGATIPASAISVGYVQHRITRVTAEGSVYTISPRLVIPRAECNVPAGLTRTFWLTVHVPHSAAPGTYEGTVKIAAEHGGTATLPLRFTVRKGTLDPVDIPAGPFGHTIDLPWYPDESATWNEAMADRSLARLREYGFTTTSGLPLLTYQGFKDGAPQIDFRTGDAQLARFRKHGFTQPVITYCGFPGLNLYFPDTSAMQAAGLSDSSAFVKAIFSAVQAHAQQAGWLPIYWNLGDEPIGDDVTRSAENAEAYHAAFPKGPPWFTAASSFQGSNASDPHFRLAKALSVVAWNGHDEPGVELLHKAGGQWAFYNGGNRWTFGTYMYKAAKQFGMTYRLSWHWNACAGDPYYALDCREDDYAWCNASPDGELIPSVEFERLREGLDDYRRLLTLERLVKETPGTAAALTGEAFLKGTLGRFKLGDREPPSAQAFAKFRSEIDAAIEALR